jgi:hypothetical protein
MTSLPSVAAMTYAVAGIRWLRQEVESRAGGW